MAPHAIISQTFSSRTRTLLFFTSDKLFTLQRTISRQLFLRPSPSTASPSSGSPTARSGGRGDSPQAGSSSGSPHASHVELPAGWDCRRDPVSGRIYFIDRVHKVNTWSDPRPLPEGWEAEVDHETGNVVFVSAGGAVKTLKDPRSPIEIVESPRLHAKKQNLKIWRF